MMSLYFVFRICIVHFYYLTLLCVFILATNSQPNTSAFRRFYKKTDVNNENAYTSDINSSDKNAVLKEFSGEDDGGFIYAGDSYLNQNVQYDESVDEDEENIKFSDQPFGSRITNGYIQENITKSPWVVCIFYADVLPVRKIVSCACGGTIISNKHILSAAHCVLKCPHGECKIKHKWFYVVVGQTFPRQTQRFEKVESFHLINEPRGTTKSRVNKIRCFTNDIVVLELQEPIHFGENVKAIHLPPPVSYDSKIGSTSTTRLIQQTQFCRVYGWGWGGGIKTGLKSVFAQLTDCNFPRIEKSSCPRTRFCTYQYEEIGSPCRGDSGGPLVCDGVLHGVVTGRWGECSKANRRVFQRVEVFVSWIREVMRGLA